MPADNERRYWLWVARPQYYLDENGRDREDLDPEIVADSDGWWTCHRDTRQGDLVFLWRTRPKSDIAYLIRAETDAYSIIDDKLARTEHWSYGCEYRVLHKFRHPVTIQDLRQNPDLHDWGAYGGRFQRSVFRIPTAHWQTLNQLAATKNPGYAGFLTGIEAATTGIRIDTERQLEDLLAGDLTVLKPHGWELELRGRQVVCVGSGGRIDLLCYDRRRKRHVVLELKNVCAGRNTFGQVSAYMGWVQDRLAGGKPVLGLVISRGYDVRFQAALRTSNQVFHLDVGALRL